MTKAKESSLTLDNTEVLINQWTGSQSIDYTIPPQYRVSKVEVMYAEDSGGGLTAHYSDSTSGDIIYYVGPHGLHPSGAKVQGSPVTGKRVSRVTGYVTSYGGKYGSYGVVYLYAVTESWN